MTVDELLSKISELKERGVSGDSPVMVTCRVLKGVVLRELQELDSLGWSSVLSFSDHDIKVEIMTIESDEEDDSLGLHIRIGPDWEHTPPI